MQVWHGGDPEWAICLNPPIRPPATLCLLTNTERSVRFIERLQRGAHDTTKKKLTLLQRPKGRMPRIHSYFDFSYPTSISTSVAVVLAAEYERLRMLSLQMPFTVDLDKWNGDVFRKLYQLGFFEIVGISPQRDDVIIDHGDSQTMQIVSACNADDLERVDTALQKLTKFMQLSSDQSDAVTIELLTGLSEAMGNVTNHAYPPYYSPPYPHIGRLWVSATADRANQTLTLVIYDQGATIPVTYPRIQRLEQVMGFLGRALRNSPRFEYQNDGTYIRAALRYGGSRTDRDYRGKGLPQMISVLDRVGRGTIAVFSRGGWCYRDVNGRFRSGALPYSLGGTLIEWTVELSSSGKVDSHDH